MGSKPGPQICKTCAVPIESNPWAPNKVFKLYSIAGKLCLGMRKT